MTISGQNKEKIVTKHTQITEEAQICNRFKFRTKFPNQKWGVWDLHMSGNCPQPCPYSLVLLQSLLTLQRPVLQSFVAGCFPAINHRIIAASVKSGEKQNQWLQGDETGGSLRSKRQGYGIALCITARDNTGVSVGL